MKMLDELILEFGNLKAEEGFGELAVYYKNKHVLVKQIPEFFYIKAFIEWLDQYGDTLI